VDLIGELIQNKKADNSLPIKEILTELIQYEKLSRKDQFKHLADNPMLQKKLPYCWKAFEGDSRMHWLLNELSTIIETLSDRPLDIFSDLTDHYSEKQKKQIAIIGNALQYSFRHSTLGQIPSTFNYDNALYLTNEREENEYHTSIIHVVDKQINVYTGIIETDSNASDDSDEDGILSPFTYSVNDQTITIPTYSVQGNNDYPFAYTPYHSISMPSSSEVCYTAKHKPFTPTTVELPKSDIQTLAFHKYNLEIVANILLTYEPEPTEKAVFLAKLNSQRVHNDEN